MILGRTTTLSHSAKEVLLIVGSLSMPKKPLTIDTQEIGGQAVEVFFTVGTARVNGDPINTEILKKRSGSSVRFLTVCCTNTYFSITLC